MNLTVTERVQRVIDEGADLYWILDVSEDCTDEELRKAYKRLAGIHHPDKETGDEVTFKLIKQAYDVLSDPASRALYDETGSITTQQESGTARDFIMQGVNAIINQEGVDLEHIDLVETIRVSIVNDKHNCEMVIAKVERKLNKFKKHKKRAKSKLISSVFEKNIKQLTGELDTHNKNKRMLSVAEKLIGKCVYEYEVAPIPEFTGTFTTTGPTVW